MRWDDDYQRDLALAYNGVAFYSRALAGKLPPLRMLLAQAKMASDRAQTAKSHNLQLAMLSAHIGVSFRPISPEAKAALERLKARGE